MQSASTGKSLQGGNRGGYNHRFCPSVHVTVLNLIDACYWKKHRVSLQITWQLGGEKMMEVEAVTSLGGGWTSMRVSCQLHFGRAQPPSARGSKSAGNLRPRGFDLKAAKRALYNFFSSIFHYVLPDLKACRPARYAGRVPEEKAQRRNSSQLC